MGNKGWRTSEFWVAVTTALLPILNSTFGWGIPAETALGLVAYILGRSGVKAVNAVKGTK
jgi:hypothetical protein